MNPSVALFAEIVRRYCAWSEEQALVDPHEDIKVARRLLAELHSSVLDLPENCPDGDTDDSVTTEAWRAVYSRFESLPVSGHWLVFNSLEYEEPVFNTLSDDLADIYRDLKEGLILFDKGRVEEAIWEWRFHFEIHWGRHLTDAQRAIHDYFS